MALKRKAAAPDAFMIRPDDPPVVQAIIEQFEGEWSDEVWGEMLKKLSPEDAAELRKHFSGSVRLTVSSLELLKRLPAFKELVELEARVSVAVRLVKSRMEDKLFDRFAKSDRFRPAALVEMLDKQFEPPPPPPAAAAFGSPFGGMVVAAGPFGKSPFGPQVGMAASSSAGPFGISPFGPQVGMAASSSDDHVAAVCALELAMASAPEPDEDEDEDL
jgi:hypothetical protein